MVTPVSIAASTRIGHVALTVADLDSQIGFYQAVLGLRMHRREANGATMGVGQEDLLRLVASPGATRRRGTTGLYHFAVLLPSRKELARALARLFSLRYRNYPTDHVMTETTYLSDPEGNGIELYADTPERGTWGMFGGTFGARTAGGRITSGRDPLDVDSLLRLLSSDDRLDDPMPAETRIGHIHLHVAHIGDAVDFYHGLLGFDTTMALPEMGMAFVSAGGYHHHIGLNTWLGEGAPPAPRGAQGLGYFTVVLPEARELERIAERLASAQVEVQPMESGLFVRDPSDNGVWLTARPEIPPAIERA
jgi:catechol 2,3-dioxygenase